MVLGLLNACQPIKRLDPNLRVLRFDVLFALLSVPRQPDRRQSLLISVFFFLCKLVQWPLSCAVFLFHLERSLHVELVDLLVFN